MTLLPGLIDTHVHLGFDASTAPVAHLQAATDDALLQRMRANAATALAAGITTVRDLGDRAFLAVALRESFAAEPGTGPEIIAAGPPLTSPGGHCHFMGGEVAGEDGIRRAVRESVARGADLIKIMATGGALTPTSNPLAPQFTVAEVAAAVHEAHELGRPVTVHAHATVGMRLAVDAGADGIEHGMFWVEDGVRIDPALVDRIAENGTWICPTVGIRPDREGENPPPPAVAARLAHFPAVLAALHAAGVRVVAGSDAEIGPVKPHDVLPYSIRAMAAGGMSNLAALRSATSQPALACGVETVRAGSRRARTPTSSSSPATPSPTSTHSIRSVPFIAQDTSPVTETAHPVHPGSESTPGNRPRKRLRRCGPPGGVGRQRCPARRTGPGNAI